MANKQHQAQVEDVHEIASAMPGVTVWPGSGDNPVYQVGRKSFVFFRNRRPDAVDPFNGERYTDSKTRSYRAPRLDASMSGSNHERLNPSG